MKVGATFLRHGLLVISVGGLLGSLMAVATAPVPLTIGHRGLGQRHAPEPENSVLALRSAFEKGVDAVEFDVQLTSDGEAVLAHDPRLSRITNGSGCVDRHTLAELRALRLKDATGRVHEYLAPATLREALDAIREYDRPERSFLADIHIKVFDGFKGDVTGVGTFECTTPNRTELTRTVLEVVREAGLLDRVIFTAFDHRVLDQIKRDRQGQRVGLITLLAPAHALSRAQAAHYEFVALNAGHFEPWHVTRAHELGLGVLIWSLSGNANMRFEAGAGVDGWIADNVPGAIALQAELRGTASR